MGDKTRIGSMKESSSLWVKNGQFRGCVCGGVSGLAGRYC